ncbi:MAG: stage V sporulation protein AD [Prevotella sp.]|nr:stage V sporulation protein AD [Staphylococcus sp.]MCM1349816.1 stage V sporulation protein AD [Prevotella sp.]
MKKIGKNSVEFNHVYLRTSSAISGPKEAEGPLGQYFDASYKDNYCGGQNWEQAEIILQQHAIEAALSKSGLKMDEIDLAIGGDLNNQIAVTNYSLRAYDVAYLGVFSACSTCTQSMLLASMLVDSGYGENIITITSSHNSTSERQFRYPTEYGGQKPTSMTSTATGAGASIISSVPSSIRVTRATIGKIVDPDLSDAQDMGRTMAPAAATTLRTHLEDFQIEPSEYDLILTGDLSKYGSEIFLKILEEWQIQTPENTNDAGLMLYDIEKQNVFAGGSGCGCVTLVTLGYVVHALKTGKYNKVLIIATGALMNPIMVAQNESIPAIAHAIALERSML